MQFQTPKQSLFAGAAVRFFTVLQVTVAFGCAGLSQAPVPAPGPGLAPLPAEIPALHARQASPHTFERPVAAVPVPEHAGVWLVAEQTGRLLQLDLGNPNRPPDLFADLRDRTDASSVESGLLGIAFDPEFPKTRRVFVSYTGAGLISRLSSFQVEPGAGSFTPQSETVRLELVQPGDVHNGGKILFGPDGFLYMGFGDGAQGMDPLHHGQNPSTWFGSILRIDVSGGSGYRVPDDNPFVRGGGRPEVFAYGFRNPWGIGFDQESGALWVADVGENRWEEIDRVVPGGNYGWSLREGAHCAREEPCDTGDLIDPVFEYRHGPGCSVTGGSVYRGTGFPWLDGAYLFSDWCSGEVWALFQGDPGVEAIRVAETGLSVTALITGPEGNLYLLDYRGGGFHRLAP